MIPLQDSFLATSQTLYQYAIIIIYVVVVVVMVVVMVVHPTEQRLTQNITAVHL